MKPSDRAVSGKLAALFRAGLIVVFGFLVFRDRTISFLCLALFLVVFLWWMMRRPIGEIRTTFGFVGCRWYWIFGAAAGGLALAMLDRWVEGNTLFLHGLRPFAGVAVLIGLAEELVFRGFLFGLLQKGGSPGFGLVVSTLAHSAYKVAIFLPLAVIDPWALGGLTFAVGLVLGWSRMVIRSIWPCVFFHVVFDLWVFGDGAAPWWVW